jgi:hypothetical protein
LVDHGLPIADEFGRSYHAVALALWRERRHSIDNSLAVLDLLGGYIRLDQCCPDHRLSGLAESLEDGAGDPPPVVAQGLGFIIPRLQLD